MRPREFDEDEVLERALLAFWRLGFEGCSVAALVTATGLQKQSLYNAFGDKGALFARALSRYDELSAQALAPLSRPEAGLRELRTYMETVLETFRARRTGACFMVKTAFGPEIAEPRIRRMVQASAARVRDAFELVVRRTRARGQLPARTDPKGSAAYLYCVLHGLTALASTGGTSADVSTALAQAFATIGGSR
jgi:TetR/AcrR family transcriptional repressor of nem operon